MVDIGAMKVKVGADTADAESGLRRVHASFKDAAVGGSAFALGMQVVNTGLHALETGFSSTISVAASFQHSIAAVGAVSNATKDQLKQIGDLAMDIGKATIYTATEAANAMEILAAGGTELTDILGGAAKAATDLASAGGTTLALAAETISTSMNVWKLSTSDLENVVNRLAGAANVSKFSVDDLSLAIAQGGGVAAATGVSFDDFASTIAATASSFSSGSDAGTSFKTFLQRLAAPTTDAAAAMKELGINAFDANGKMLPMSVITQQLHDSLGKMSEASRANAASTIFGSDAMRTALSLAGMTDEQFKTLSKTMGDTSAAEVAAARMTDYDVAMGNLHGSIENLQIAIGEKLLPVLADLANWASEAIPKLGEWVAGLSDTAAFDLIESAIGTMLDELMTVGDWFASHEKLTESLAVGAGVLTASVIALTAAMFALSLVNPLTAIILAAEVLAAGIAYVVLNWDDLMAKYPALETAVDAVAAAFNFTADSIDGWVTAFQDIGDAIDGIDWENPIMEVGDLQTAFDALTPDPLIQGFRDLGNSLMDLASSVTETASNVADFAGTVIDDLVRVMGWFDDFGTHVTDGLESLSGLLYDLGRDMIQGLWDGAKDKAEDFLGWVGDIPGMIKGGIQGAADGHSPWGIMVPLGEDMIAGIQIGAENAAPALKNAVGNIVSGIVGWAADQLASAMSSMMQASNMGDLAGISGSGISGPAEPIEGPFLGKSISDINSLNNAARDRVRSAAANSRAGLSGGGGGSGGGDSAKEAAKSAVKEWEDAVAEAVQQADFEKSFGDLGSKVMLGFEDALTNPKSAAKLPDMINKLIAEAKAEGVVNAADLGASIGAAIGVGLSGGGTEALTAALGAMNSAISAAGTLSADTFNKAMGEKIVDRKLVDAIGSQGKALMDSLNAALTEGGKKNIDALAKNADNMVSALMNKAPEAQAAYLGTSLMSAIKRTITDGSQAAKDALQAVMAQIKAVMDGAWLDIKSGTIIGKDAMDEMAKAMGISGKEIVTIMGFVVDSGIDQMIGSLGKLPAATAKILKDTIALLLAGKIEYDAALKRLGGAGIGTPGWVGTNPDGSHFVKSGGTPSTGDPNAGKQYIGGGQYIDIPSNPKPGDTYSFGKNPDGSDKYTMMYGDFWNPIKQSWLPGWGLPGDEAHNLSYAVGTDYVPKTGLAYLHKGEAVLTADENRGRGVASSVIFAPVITAMDGESVRRVLPTLAREFQLYLKDRGLSGFDL